MCNVSIVIKHKHNVPMLHKYSEVTPDREQNVKPSENVINAILNYSKSLEVKEVKKKKVLIHLN